MRALAKLRLPMLTAIRKTEAPLWGNDCFASPVLLSRLAVSGEPNPGHDADQGGVTVLAP